MPGYLVVVLLICGLIPWLVIALLVWLFRDVRVLRARIEHLERGLVLPLAPPLPAPSPPPPLATPTVPTPRPPASPAPPGHAATRRDRGGLEQQVGGIWMQNVGSVLLLLGAF